jgi:hypothetical protein
MDEHTNKQAQMSGHTHKRGQANTQEQRGPRQQQQQLQPLTQTKVGGRGKCDRGRGNANKGEQNKHGRATVGPVAAATAANANEGGRRGKSERGRGNMNKGGGIQTTVNKCGQEA